MEKETTSTGPTDLQLMQRAQEGELEAFELLFSRYKQRIANFVYQFVGDTHLAEDITQQAFIKVYQNLDRYKPSGKVSSWIYRIASNQAKDEIRKLKRRPTVSLNAPIRGEEMTAELGETVLDDESQRPDFKVREKEMFESLRKALDGLKPKYKEVLLLCDYEGFSYEDAAETLGITKTNVSAILCRARKKLEKLLKGTNITNE